jgi:hypothetical protein
VPGHPCPHPSITTDHRSIMRPERYRFHGE